MTAQPQRSEYSKGVLAGFFAYFVWGIVPIYWPKLQPAGPVEILSHRVIWSFLFLVLVVLVQRKTQAVLDVIRDRRKLKLLALGSLLIAVNWGTFIWCSVSGHLLDSSLGYYITPLVSVALGVIFLKEKLRRIQWVAIAIATAAVIYLAIVHGQPPLIALELAITFGIYGYVKKLAMVDAIESLTIETGLILPLALGYLYYLHTQGQNSFELLGLDHQLWMASAGIITAVPLLMFGISAIRVPMTVLGMLQYLGPTIQYFLGIYYFGEPMDYNRFIGFVITWVALVILTIDMFRNRTPKDADIVVAETD